MEELGGYIRLFRKFQQNPIWLDKEPFDKRSAWLDILFEARWGLDPNVTIIDGHIITVRRGEVAYSYQTWGTRWRWHKSKVRRWFKQLEKLGQIGTVDERKTTRLIVYQYDTYQDPRHAGDTQSDYQPTHSRHTADTQPTPTQEREERKEGEEGKWTTARFELLRRFQAVNPACARVGEQAFVASIRACTTDTHEPDVFEAVEAFERRLAGAVLHRPLAEFEAYLKKSVRDKQAQASAKKKRKRIRPGNAVALHAEK